MKTVRELAEEIGVSKVAINKKIDTLKLRNLTEKSGNKILIPENVEMALKVAFGYNDENHNDNERNENEKYRNANDNLTQTLIEMLQRELTEKNEQIKNLQTIIDQEQKLRMVTEQKLIEMQQKEDEKKETEKPRFWGRIFNRKQSETNTTEEKEQ